MHAQFHAPIDLLAILDEHAVLVEAIAGPPDP